jgi:Fe-S-cluster containining protein
MPDEPDKRENADKRNAPWYAPGLRFSCAGCGDCCGQDPGTVEFTADEERAMAAFLGVDIEQFRESYVWRKYGVISLKEKKNYDCVFLHRDEKNVRCKIYPVRPKQCRSFPFWPEILENEQEWNNYSLLCPGMDAGAFHEASEIDEYTGQSHL